MGMSIERLEQQKALSRRALLLWNSKTSDEPSEIFASDYVQYQEPVIDREGPIGLSEWAALVAAYRHAFPNISTEILSQVAEEHRVATRWRVSGRQEGPYRGAAPTGERVVWSGVSIDEFSDGRIAETWVIWDKFGQLRELGLL